MNIFKQTFSELKGYKDIKNCLDSGLSPISTDGLYPINKAQLIYTFEDDRVTLVITDDESSAKKLCDDINSMSGSKNTACMFPSKEVVLNNAEGVSREYEHIRISALLNIIRKKSKIIVASIEAVMQTVIPCEVLEKNTVMLETGQTLDIDSLINHLIKCGYSRTEKTEGTSQFSVRGSIIDIFPVNETQPLRIELWDDEIESISYFEIESQRRTDKTKEIFIAPAKELLYDKTEFSAKFMELIGSISDKKVIKKLKSDYEKLKNDMLVEDKYTAYIYPQKPSVFDYINGNIFISEYNAVKQRAEGVYLQFCEDVENLLSENLKDMFDIIFNYEDVKEKFLSHSCVFLNTFSQAIENNNISFNTVQLQSWGGEMHNLYERLAEYSKNKYKIILFAGSEKMLPVIADDIRNQGISCDIYGEVQEAIRGRVLLMHGSLSSGFEYPETKSVLIAQNRSLNVSKKSSKHKKGKQIKNLSDISAGDLVVHSTHGIGRFVGIRKIELEGVTKDYISIQYAGKDMLHVPVTQLDMVTKYVSMGDDSNVKLNKLSSMEWQKTRNNVKRAIKEMAEELIELYAKREKAKGFSCGADDEMQIDFERRFPYTETDDQLECISEIKKDMERPRPMDRLLCGDVGFGKTEVAFRAMFKAVLNGKQCALLVPTTVLAWQHYQTALARFESFPITIELLSRFRTPQQQAEILKKLEHGEIDIIIGTHRLIQKDVIFKDLGLAVIDEEQRFGVAHKEKFKQAFNGIDILTLSATPIPRTLNMAMSGLRDMSVIEEAPQNRYPVQTYVLEHDMGVIAQAICKELKRGGQVYYIHNRIETIVECVGKLQKLIPHARIVYAHGQMTEEVMSETWRQIVDGEADVLVSTTIIETGVDVPNVNTLIIENADCFGLSQLYQLRGRVGRSNRRAYAYFTFKRGKSLTEVAEKRLQAIKQFTQFGSGFRIAMRDLQIRGAGSVLSAKQHGHMSAVGYDMYLKLLSEAVAEEKGEPVVKAEDCTIDMKIDAYIPEKYIESPSQRIDIYRKIAVVSDENDKTEIIEELNDRYGKVPIAVKGLIDIAILRNNASKIGITEISQKENTVRFYIQEASFEAVTSLAEHFKGRTSFNNVGKNYISIRLIKNDKPVLMALEAVKILSA